MRDAQGVPSCCNSAPSPRSAPGWGSLGVRVVCGLPGPSDNVPATELGRAGNKKKKVLCFVFAPFSSNRDTD